MAGRSEFKDDVLGVIIGLIGEESAFLLVEAYAGLRIFVPAKAKPTTKLTGVIGLDAANKICCRYGGMQIRIPLARTWRARVYRERGWALTKIARTLGMTDVSVGQALKSLGIRNTRVIQEKLNDAVALTDQVVRTHEGAL